jgi:hypothetical protein
MMNRQGDMAVIPPTAPKRENRDPSVLANQRAAVARELAFRRRVFPNQVSKGKMSPDHADYEIKAFEHLLKRLDFMLAAGQA